MVRSLENASSSSSSAKPAVDSVAFRGETKSPVTPPPAATRRAPAPRSAGRLERILRVLRKERPENALTVRFAVEPARLDDLRAELARNHPSVGPSFLAAIMARVATVHFARLVLLEACEDGGWPPEAS